MTRLVAKVVMWLALAAVVIVAGGHFVYYLFLWEWGRAGIAGTGFTAALVVAATFLFLSRIQRIERRLDELLLIAEHGASLSSENNADTVASEIEPRPDFPWLRHPAGPQVVGLAALVAYEAPDQSVFIPVFLAAGLVISAVAGVVERVAFKRYRGRGRGSGTQPLPGAREILASRPRSLLVGFPVIGVVITAVAVGGLYVVSHYWSKPIGPGVTTLTVEVSSRGEAATNDVEVVEAVGRYCSLNSGTGVTYLGVAPGGPGGSTYLRVSPLLDEDAQDRLVGCLEDAILEWHSLDVTRTELDPR
ncbi:MAG TPA: hypothetical protein VLB29_05420 [Nocardioidaceae bacterium]|nr:hypothetical protein [Nocardioidaceae bacterium]